jgi:WD40 repeat protein
MNKNGVYYLLILLGMFVSLSLPTNVHTTAQGVSPDIGGRLEWSPDGTELVVIANNGVFIYDRAFRLLHYREQDIPNYTAFGGWSPDGSRLLMGNLILNADTLEVSREFEMNLSGWLMDGTQVFGFGNGYGEIRILDSSTGNLVKTIPLTGIQLETIAASPDGRWISSNVANGLFIFDAAEGKLATLYAPPVDFISDPVWSPDSTRIAFSASTRVPAGTPGSVSTADPTTSVLHTFNIMDVRTGEILLTSTPAVGSELIWSKYESRIAGLTMSGGAWALNVWDADTAELLASFTISTSQRLFGGLDFSPYGGVIAVGISPRAYTPSPTAPGIRPAPGAHRLTIANGMVQIIVPEASFKRLADIQTACVRQSDGAASVAIPQAQSDLGHYIAQVEAAPAAQIPPGCAADLIAIAEAILGQ